MAEDTKNFAAWMRAADIQSSVTRCADIFNSGVFNVGSSAGLMFKSAVTLVLVHLNDLLQKAKTRWTKNKFR